MAYSMLIFFTFLVLKCSKHFELFFINATDDLGLGLIPDIFLFSRTDNIFVRSRLY
jgi:hypothetical protein